MPSLPVVEDLKVPVDRVGQFEPRPPAPGRLSSSPGVRAQNDSITASSQRSPIEPIDTTSPALMACWVNAQDVNCAGSGVVATLSCWAERRCSLRASAGVCQLRVLRGRVVSVPRRHCCGRMPGRRAAIRPVPPRQAQRGSGAWNWPCLLPFLGGCARCYGTRWPIAGNAADHLVRNRQKPRLTCRDARQEISAEGPKSPRLVLGAWCLSRLPQPHGAKPRHRRQSLPAPEQSTSRQVGGTRGQRTSLAAVRWPSR